MPPTGRHAAARCGGAAARGAAPALHQKAEARRRPVSGRHAAPLQRWGGGGVERWRGAGGLPAHPAARRGGAARRPAGAAATSWSISPPVGPSTGEACTPPLQPGAAARRRNACRRYIRAQQPASGPGPAPARRCPPLSRRPAIAKYKRVITSHETDGAHQ